MIHNIPQPVLEEELTKLIAQDPNITLMKGWSIHAVSQVSPTPSNLTCFGHWLLTICVNAYLG